MNLLCVSDKRYRFIHSPEIQERFSDIEFVIGCGDLPYYYLEYIRRMLKIPLFYVRGNHNHPEEFHPAGIRRYPKGCVDLHCRTRIFGGILMAGIEGSLQYNDRGYYQYTQFEMWWNVAKLIPGLLLNKLRYGRYLDVFVSHAPAWKIHDEKDRTHQGIKAFRWLLQTFEPKYHFHGHIHVYHGETKTVTEFKNTLVINTFGYREIQLDLP